MKKWWKESVVYEIYPRSFCDSNGDGIGDLNGITSKLDYIKELGVDVIWMTPIYGSPNVDNGYDISDYRNINPEYGTMEDFEHLLAEAHKRGIRIVMDLVANHSSDQHPYFLESKSSVDNPKRDYYFWRPPVDGHEPTNWRNAHGNSAWSYDETTGMYYLHCFAKEQPDINWDNKVVREEIYDMMNFWCKKGIDGYRMDVISLIPKPEVFKDAVPKTKDSYELSAGYNISYGPRVHEYIREMKEKVLDHYDLMTVGECGGVTTDQACLFAGIDEKELGMVFQFEHINVDNDERGKWVKLPSPVKALKDNLSKWQYELNGKAWNSLYFNNHDQPRAISRIGDNSPISAKAIALALYNMQGTPYLYQGEEIGMTNYPFKGMDEYDDIECISAYKKIMEEGEREEAEVLEAIAYRSRENARTPMQWNEEKEAGFTSGTPWLTVNPNYKEINVASQIKDPDSVFSFYKKMISLRHDEIFGDTIVYGDYKLILSEDEDIFAYVRSYEGKRLLVLSNLSAKTRICHLAENLEENVDNFMNDLSCDEQGTMLLSTYSDAKLADTMELRPWEAFICVL